MNSSEMKIQCTIQDKIANVEFSIQNVSRVRKELEENSVMVKAEVQRSVSVQLDALRQRELQLLRQVDALISHQSAMLQMQLSKLYQVLGRFKAASHWATKDGDNFDLACLSDQEPYSISTCHIHYEPTQERDLSLAIQRFGRFEAKGATRNVFLLPEEEEYGDGDHHILHKTLQADNMNKIKVCFPKLSLKSEEWLLDSKKILDEFDLCETSSSNSDRADSIELLSYPDSEDNQMWLHVSEKESCTCLNEGTVEIENLDSLACIPNSKLSSLLSVSIPSVPTVCKSSSQKCSTFKECLCEESCLVSNLKEQMKKQNLGNGFQQQDCINKAVKEAYKHQEWLQTKQAGNTEIKISGEKLDIPDKWLDSLKHTKMAEKLESEKWLESLKFTSNDSSNWLAACSNQGVVKCESKESVPVMQKWLAETKVSKTDNTSWLLSATSNVEEKSDKPEVKKKSRFSASWLCSMNTNRNAISKQMYNLYFQNENASWLAGQSVKGKEWLVAR